MAISDGSANAPVGAPQLPHLLDSYGANRPPWQVAGVDYHVGVPDNLTLKNPVTISMAGVTVDASTHIITVNGNNVTLDGYDFSLNGGWGVVINGNNTTIQNSNFLVGANGNAPILGTQSSGSVNVSNCTIDGNDSPAVGGLVEMRGTGTLTVDHSWLKNSVDDLIQMHNNGPAGAVIEYNLIQNAGMAAGAHGDWTEFIGGPFTATIKYNTALQQGGSSQGFMVEPDFGSSPGVITSGEIGNNTMMGSVNAFTAVTVPDIVNSFTVHDNYFDPSQTLLGLAIGGIRGGPDSSPKSIYMHNVNMTSGAIVQDSNIPVTPPPSAPSAPVIASFSPDTSAGAGVTDAKQLTLTGTAPANTTIKVYDGSTQIGTATTSSTGSWDYITSILTDAKHMLTATATDATGQTSTASAPLTVTVDTHVPAAPVLVSDPIVNPNHVQLSGTAEANSTITVYDGTTVVGTGTTNSTGSWSVTTGALSAGTHALTATATDVAGTVSAASQSLDPVIPAPPAPTPTPTPPAAPTIVSFSPDTGVVGDLITNDPTLMLTGTAVANTTVKVFDGTTQIGTATADGSGQWSLTTTALTDGAHNLTATDTDASGQTSAPSAAFAVTIDTHAPGAPTIAAYSQAGAAVGQTTTLNDLVLKGTAEAGSTIDVFDGGKQIGTATTNSAGAWSYDTGNLATSSHSFTAKAIDAAGNTSAASTALAETVTAPTTSAPTPTPTASIDFLNVREHCWNDSFTIKGTADAYSQVKLYDGTVSLGTVTANAHGTWWFNTGPVSDTLHTITAQEVDHAGHVIATSSGAAIIAGSNTSTLTGTQGNDFLFSSSSQVNDTFVFASNFGHSTVEGFTVSGPGQDTIQFSKSVFDSFASVLAHASQVGHDVVISSGHDTLTMKNTQLGALHSSDFHFA